jgi:Flp pilus assembly protein TadB
VSALALVVLGAALAVAPGRAGPAYRLRALHAPGREARPRAGSAADPVLRLAVLAGAAIALVGAAVGGVAGGGVGVLLGVACALVLVRRGVGRARPRPDPLSEAGAWDQLGACLRAGLPLDRAVRAVAPLLPPAPAAALTGVADLAALGADPVAAWEPALGEPSTARLARAARRSARSGSAIAEVAATVAADVRAEAADAVGARAERAGVLVTGPLGLCFLPAFLALGIVPVVVGLAGPLLEQR